MSRSSSADTVDSHDDELMHAHEGTLRSYLTGFALAVILTIIPFWLVMGNVIASTAVTIAIILVLAAAQILVHMFFFLHVDARSEGGWNMLALIFAAVLVIIVLGASIWVMHEENLHMMPQMNQVQYQSIGALSRP